MSTSKSAILGTWNTLPERHAPLRTRRRCEKRSNMVALRPPHRPHGTARTDTRGMQSRVLVACTMLMVMRYRKKPSFVLLCLPGGHPMTCTLSCMNPVSAVDQHTELMHVERYNREKHSPLRTDTNTVLSKQYTVVYSNICIVYVREKIVSSSRENPRRARSAEDQRFWNMGRLVS